MNVDLNQILAVGLTVSQLFTQSVDQFRIAFNPQTDQEQVAQLLHTGCEILKKEFGNTRVNMDTAVFQNLDELEAAKALEKTKSDQQQNGTLGEEDISSDLTASSSERKEKTLGERLGKIDIDGVRRAYKQFCMQQKVDHPVNLEAAITYFNTVMKDLPNPEILKDLHLPQASFILDRTGDRFTEIFVDGQRRRWLPLSEMPQHLKLAFVDTEDKRFYKHIGIDIRGIVRAFSENSLQGKGRPQGASTITQQVVKNLLLNNKKDWDKPNFERKIPEMYLAVLLEDYFTKAQDQSLPIDQRKQLAKDRILELYLNQSYLGRTSSGVEMAAQSYFKKSARDVDMAEAAFLAAMTKGPTFYSPDKHPDRALDRRQYVLNEMKQEEERKAKEGDPSARPISDADFKLNATKSVQFEDFESPRTRSAYYFVNEIIREAKDLNHPLTSSSFTVRSTVHPELQKLVDQTLRQGLIDYEAQAGTQRFTKAAGNIEKEIRDNDAAWDEIINKTRPDSYWDLHWPLAVVLETPSTVIRKNGRRQTSSGWKVGLSDGSTAKLTGVTGGASSILKQFDLVYVDLSRKQAKLIIPPRVQGGMVVIENATGRILAMSGGFSYAESPFNRVTQGPGMQPGSTIKPFTYLAALHMNFQPNTLIANTPFHLNPIERGGQPFDPHNYDGRAYGLVTMRQGLERSLNIPASRMMSKLGNTPAEGLEYIVALTQALGIYGDEVDKKYPFVLGSQPARLINMVKAYATIANDGLQPKPHVIEEIVSNDKLVYRHKRFNLQPIGFDNRPDNQDRVAFYQLRRLLMTTVQDEAEGIQINGTAKALKDLSGYVGCKTGTTNDFKNAWFIGFTDKITVGTWIAYDSTKVRSTLGKGFTGGRIALPMAEKVIRRSFDLYGKRPLPGPPEEIRSQIVEYPIDRATGEFNARSNYREVFRVANNTRLPMNTWQSALNQDERYMSMSGAHSEDDGYYGDQQAYDGYPQYDVPNQYDQRNDYYMPGAENPYEQNQRRGRPNDSFFSGFPFFQ